MSAPHVSLLLAQQLVNGTSATSKRVEAFTLVRTNHPNAISTSVDEALSATQAAKRAWKLDANGGVTLRFDRKRRSGDL